LRVKEAEVIKSIKIRENIKVTSTALTNFARQILLESVPEIHVGEAIDVVDEPSDDPKVSIKSHTFECKSPAYPGWYWAVTVVDIGEQHEKTVSEINLLPGSQALVPSAWKPWASRVQAGDLGVGDILPTEENDPRLTAGFTGLDELDADFNQLHPNQWELGIGREQILSAQGLDLAVDRWYSGDNGPRSAMAKSAPANCSTCGFLIPIGGSLGQAFGVCANEFGAADGQIVAINFGCGAHSSVRSEIRDLVPVVGLVVDDISDDLAQATDLSFGEAVNENVGDKDSFDHNSYSGLVQIDSEQEFQHVAIIDAIEALSEEI